MPTTLGPKYDIEWRGRPPHMLREDVPVWYRFLVDWGFLIDALYYDCLLGGIALTEEEQSDPMKRMWRANTAKRADAIAELENEIWIIEVAHRPGLRAIGQLLTYQYLWREDPKIEKPDKMVLVCQDFDTDLFAAAARSGILIYAVPTDGGPRSPVVPTPLPQPE